MHKRPKHRSGHATPACDRGIIGAMRAAVFGAAILFLVPESFVLADDDSSTAETPATQPVGHDIIITRDGQRYEGKLHRSPEGWNITQADGSTITVSPDNVASVSLGPAGGPSQRSASSGADALASLRRSLEAVGDPAAAVERCNRFIGQYAGTDTARDAQADLVTWQNRRDKHMVKVGSQWVTPAERAVLAGQADAVARQAANLMLQNQPKAAESAARQALADDPSSPAALYLCGLFDFQHNKIADARKRFEAVNAQVIHAPTLNNLAVVMFRQNQQPLGAKYYDQAINAAPLSRQLLNNVAEALAVLSDDSRRSPMVQRLIVDFAQQDRQLQQILAQEGLYHWGATWVDAVTLQRVQDAQAQVDKQLKDLSDQDQADRDRLAQINRVLVDDQHTMQQMSAESWVSDGKGNVVQITMPSNYYEIKANIVKLQTESGQIQQRLGQSAQQAKKISQTVPVPKYTSQQLLIGAEGAPFESGPMADQGQIPTTGPATRPVRSWSGQSSAGGGTTQPASQSEPASQPG